jgi:hypothetical protein
MNLQHILGFTPHNSPLSTDRPSPGNQRIPIRPSRRCQKIHLQHDDHLPAIPDPKRRLKLKPDERLEPPPVPHAASTGAAAAPPLQPRTEPHPTHRRPCSGGFSTPKSG